MKKTIALGLFTIAILCTSLYVFARNDKSLSGDKKFLQDWNKAGEKKLEEVTKKQQAEKLLKESEQARIEKEKLLGINNTGDQGKLSQ